VNSKISVTTVNGRVVVLLPRYAGSFEIDVTSRLNRGETALLEIRPSANEHGNAIQSIKAIRQAFDLMLRDAKDVWDRRPVKVEIEASRVDEAEAILTNAGVSCRGASIVERLAALATPDGQTKVSVGDETFTVPTHLAEQLLTVLRDSCSSRPTSPSQRVKIKLVTPSGPHNNATTIRALREAFGLSLIEAKRLQESMPTHIWVWSSELPRIENTLTNARIIYQGTSLMERIAALSDVESDDQSGQTAEVG